MEENRYKGRVMERAVEEKGEIIERAKQIDHNTIYGKLLCLFFL